MWPTTSLATQGRPSARRIAGTARQLQLAPKADDDELQQSRPSARRWGGRNLPESARPPQDLPHPLPTATSQPIPSPPRPARGREITVKQQRRRKSPTLSLALFKPLPPIAAARSTDDRCRLPPAREGASPTQLDAGDPQKHGKKPNTTSIEPKLSNQTRPKQLIYTGEKIGPLLSHLRPATPAGEASDRAEEHTRALKLQ